MLSGVTSDVTQKQIEVFMKQACIQTGTSIFESVRVISALQMAYVVFPTINSAKMIYRVRTNKYVNVQTLNGSFILNGKDKIEVSFSTDCSRGGRQDIGEKVGG